MKRIRTLPYGYELRNGKVDVVESEACVLHRIYRMYEDGGSLNTIACALTKQHIPYSSVDTVWSKGKVKCILENPKYLGQNGFPAILEKALFERVRELYKKKTQAWQAPMEYPQKHIWKRLFCGGCKGRLKRIGGSIKNVTLLECDGCGIRIRIETNAFIHTLSARFQEAMASSQEPASYYPTQELMRQENEIERQIEKALDGKETRRLILEAAAMRYALCPNTIQEDTADTDDTSGWRVFKEKVDSVLISGAGEIHIRLKPERT